MRRWRERVERTLAVWAYPEEDRPEGALAAEDRFLDGLARRVAWQAEAAYGGCVGPALPEPDGRWNLDALERLVRSAAAAPERVYEWRCYLVFLRDYADAAGFLPADFDPLVSAAFADALDA